MRNKTNLDDIKKKIIPILENHGVKKAGLFGSCVRGEVKKDSDIDILVQITDDISLLDFVGVKLELEEALGRKVDLVEYDTIKPLIRDRILSEQMVII
jgi:predicted nucleotidyltransferase